MICETAYDRAVAWYPAIQATIRLLFVALVGVAAALNAAPARADNVDGAWSTLEDWPLISIHAAITPDGRVLTYGTKSDGKQTGYFIYDVWDPTAGLTGGHMTLNNMTLTDIFCSSQIILPQSGEILIAGGDNWTGTGTTNTGNNNSNLFDFGDNTLARSASMNRSRWYSSSTALANGEIYIQGGSGGNDRPEVRQTDGAFRLLSGAPTNGYATLFPRNFLAPDGRVFGYDTNANMYFVDASGTGSIVSAGQFSSAYVGWTSGAAMFGPGKILQMGGNSSGAAVIDINGPAPTVTPTASLSSRRHWVSATVLPNGHVLATGGTSSANQLIGVNNNAEIWNPATGQWHVGSAGAVARMYHSSALLLPDATVLVAGGGAPGPLNNTNAEIYYPPYLYAPGGGLATRPEIITAPDTANVGDSLAVQVDASTISRVTVVKTGSVTHSVNMDQRFIELPFQVSGNMLQVDLPLRASDTPPGYYMMFVIDDAGVPSLSSMLRINIDPTPNTAVDYTPAIGGGGGGEFQLACNVDEILVGVHGKFETYVNQIGPQCVKMDQFGHWIGDPVDRPVTGTTTSGTSFSKSCARDSAMSGFQGRAGQYVNQIDIECRALTSAGGLSGAGQFLGGDGGPGGTARGPFRCDTDNPAYALYGRSGGWLDSFGLQCRQGAITPISVNSDPVVANPGSQSGVIGVAVNLQINASDGDGDTLIFSSTGLPPGLSINAGTGLIRGTPTSDGTFSVEVSVTDGTAADSKIFEWLIDASPPLSVDPMSAQVPQEVDTVINFTASSSGGVNVVYKWDLGAGEPETAYSSSPTVSHTYTDPGIYYVTLTVNDDAGVPQIQTFVQAIHLPHTANRPASSTNITFEDRGAGSSRIWVVNQDNDSVTGFDAVSHVKVAEIPVGDAPRSIAIAPDGRIWVANKSSASISVVDPNTLGVSQSITLPFASQPYGLVFSPVRNEAYVVLQATGDVLKLDASSGGQLGSVNAGPNVRHLAIDAAGSSLYVSRFVTPRQPGEETATVDSQIGGVNAGGEILVVDSATMAVSTTIVLQHQPSDLVDAEDQGRGVPNYVGAVAISPDGTSARVPSKLDNIARGELRDPGFNLNFQNTVRSISSRIDLATNTEDYARRLDYDNASLSSAAIFDPSGVYAFVALETSQEVVVVDAYDFAELFRIDVGHAPQGLAVSPDGMRLYVNNFMDRTVDVFDLTTLQTLGQWSVSAIGTLPAVTTEALSADVLQGKKLFYDARDTRLARDRYLSCASCHNDGSGDGRVWDLTGFGEGLRNTIDLRGVGADHGRAHWSGNFDEIQDFEGQIRALSGGTGLMSDTDFNTGTRSEPLGDPKAGISADLDALAAYVASLDEVAPSPYRNSDGSLTSDGVAGRDLFVRENCAGCHSGVKFTDSESGAMHDIGTIKASSGSRLGGALTGFDTPTLIGAWASAPYLHDGSASTLVDAIAAHNGFALTGSELNQLAAFVNQLDAVTAISFFICAGCEDLSGITTTSYGGQDADGNVTVLNGGVAIRLQDNTWRWTDATYDITPDTVLEFTFESTVEGEIQGIGFDENIGLSSNRIFKIHGTQGWGIRDFDTYAPPGQQTFVIPVGQYYTGTGMRMVFANDDDAGRGSDATYSNVRVYEQAATPVPPVIEAPGDQTSVISTAVLLSISASDANGDALAFSATGLPPGLDIASDGTISGVPTTLGTFTAVVTVADGVSGEDSTSFDWTIEDVPVPVPPVIDNPGNQSNRVNTSVNLVVTATDADGDALTFSAVGLPTGLDISPDGTVSGTATVLGTFTATVSVTDNITGSVSATFDWVIEEAPACADCEDFSAITTSAYAGQDADGNISVVDGGAAIRVQDNTWRWTDTLYDITPDTMLEFTFESTVEGEIQGIGFDDNIALNSGRVFKIHGTQGWGIPNFDTYAPPGQQTYVIPVGQYYTGTGMRMVFANDDDAGRGSDATYSNVRVYEQAATPVPPVIEAPGDQTSVIATAVLLSMSASDANGDALAFSATGLPPGLDIASDGTINGVPTTLGIFTVVVTVADGVSGEDSTTFDWTIEDAPVPVAPVIDNPGNQSNRVNTSVNLVVTATDADGDALTFSAVGLPTGLDISPDGTVSGTATVLGTFTATVSVTDNITGSVSATFDWVIEEAPACADCEDFSAITTSAYAGQDADGNISVVDGGAAIRVQDNTWRWTDTLYDITPDTMLEFTFESTVEGEIQGIGFDDNIALNSGRVFKIHGTQGWGIPNFDTYAPPGQQTYVIPVGQYYTGIGMRMVFANDDDVGRGSDATYSNVRVYETQ